MPPKYRSMYLAMILSAALAAPLPVAAELPQLAACRAASTIKIDGKLDDTTWQLSIVAGEMRLLGSKQAAARATTFRVLHDDAALYIGVTCAIPAGGRHRLPASKAKTHDGPAYGDESIECYMQPAGSADYFHFAVNTIGTRYEGKGFDKTWDCDWTTACVRGEAAWVAEVRIPFAGLGMEKAPAPDTEWRFNLARNDRINQQYHTWANLARGFHEPESFGVLRFTEAAVGWGPATLYRAGSDVVVVAPVRAGPSPISIKGILRVRSPAGDNVFEPGVTLAAEQHGKMEAVAPGAFQPETGVWMQVQAMLQDRILYRSPPLTVPPDALRPPKPEQPSPVTIENDTVALTFDQNTGRLLSARNMPAGIDLAFGERGLPIAEVETVRYRKNPRFFRDEDTTRIVPDYETLARVTKRMTDAGQELVIEHRIAGYIPLQFRIVVPGKGVETQWYVRLDNRRTVRPSKSVVVHRLRYPCLDGLPDTLCGETPFVVVPVLMGQKFPDPGKTLGQQRPISYIGRATMGWFDFYGNDGGLYFKVGDLGPLPQTDLILQSDTTTRRLRLGIQRWALCWPGEVWEPGPCGVAVHAGDWHRAADLYRAWFRGNFSCHPVPDWLRDADGYAMSGGPSYEFADFPRAIRHAKAMGIKYIQLWSEMTGGDISYHAFAFPNPYMGSEKELKRAVAELHREGGHIGVYLNFNTGDPLLGTFVRQPRLDQKIPRDIPRPALDYMNDNWIQQSIMSHAGSYSMWSTTVPGYLDDYWNQCPGASKWTDFYHYWVVDKWAKEYKIDVWYLDSCPVSRGSPCFAFDHGHTRPAPEGQSIIEFYKRLNRDKPKRFCIMQEYSSDRLLPYSTHALGLMWHPQHAHPEVVRYTLPEYPLFSGMCNGTKGMKQFYPGERLTPKDAIERVFLIGNRYEFPMSTRPLDMVDTWKRDMVALRRACNPEMNHGDFLDNIGLGPLPEHVHARAFRNNTRTRVVVTLLDRRKDNRSSFGLTLKLSDMGVGEPRKAWLKALKEKSDLKSAHKDGLCTIEIPTYGDRAAAVFVETSAP